MLTRLLLRLLAIGFAATIGATLFAGPAVAGDGTGSVDCSQSTPQNPKPGCDATAGTGGNKGTTTGGNGGGNQSGDGKCRNPKGVVIPCERDGGWASADGCYYKPIDVSASTVAALGGQPAGQGGWYNKMCYNDAGGVTQGLGGPVWIAGAPPVVSPEVLARQARARLNLPEVTIRVSPSGDQLVGLPTWLSLDPSSWHPESATASVPGVSVTATATPTQAVWSMGNGDSVVCHGPGTPWRPGTDPAAASPDCGYRYLHSSAGASGGAFKVTVTISWQVTWAGAGQNGTIPGLTTTGTVQVRVAESQTVITP